MFWRNGFEPLAALDNNGDGSLTGEELDCIGVWQNRNGNGISDVGEIRLAREFGIVAIGVHANGEEGGALLNQNGVTLSDGRSLTLFDGAPRSVAGILSEARGVSGNVLENSLSAICSERKQMPRA